MKLKFDYADIGADVLERMGAHPVSAVVMILIVMMSLPAILLLFGIGWMKVNVFDRMTPKLRSRIKNLVGRRV